MGGEPGHIVTGTDEPCGCSSHGHLEAIAGDASSGLPARPTPPDLKEL